MVRLLSPQVSTSGNFSASKGFAIVSIIIVIALVISLVIGGVYFLISKGTIKNPLQKSSSLGEQIYKQQNPLGDKAPETNPFAKINPFKGVYKNPFE
ncbi:hypothetical protein HYZ78_03460 [Candidatus Microgenomates bacterium]|nr:hypothetical protein [Candidatus Microgenomates bacterium]